MLELKEILINYELGHTVLTELEQIGFRVVSDENSVYQIGYNLEIALDSDFEKIVYNSGFVETNDSMNIKLTNEVSKIESTKNYYLRAKVKTNIGETNWKESSFTTGLLNNKEWVAKFITIENSEDKDDSKTFYLRKEINLPKKVKAAFIHSTALGIYKLTVNGKKVSDDVLTPGWTSYNKHLLYQTYDITNLLENDSKNVVGTIVGAGWYKGIMGFLRQRNHYGEIAAFACQIHVNYEDGTSEIISTDNTWKGALSPVLFAEIYDGETYDARCEIENFDKISCTYDKWLDVFEINFNKSVLRAQTHCKIREITEIKPKKLLKTSKNETVIDFGQNLTGWVRFKVKGKKDDKVILRFFEVLDAKGDVYLDNLRSAKQTITYICKNDDEVIFNPSFTFQGFQFMEILSYPTDINLDDFTAYAVHSNMKETGSFECSNSDINQLQHNIKWGMKGNFLDLPTDCPQRDERLGWTGDAQIFCRTASYIMNTNSFYRKWLRDLKADQTEDGGVPHVVPDILIGNSHEDRLMKDGEHSAAAWADAAVIVPWTMYQVYGDKNVILEQYDSMKKWIGFMQKHAVDNIWNYKLQFGDWVALDAEEGSYFGATPNDLTCTAFYAYSTNLFAKMAKVVGKENDYNEYSRLYNEIVQSYQEKFFTNEGHITAQTQTAQIVSLYFNLVPEKYIEIVAKDLVKLLEKENGHLVTGFVGTPYFCHVLSKNGYVKEAYELLLKDDFPSWLYQVKQGATTIWEHWDGKKPDGTMWSADMNSFNHYAYGAVGDWLYRVVAGIEIDEETPAYKNIIISPEIGGDLDYAKGVFESVYGDVVSSWTVKENEVTLNVQIPVNTTAQIKLNSVDRIIDSKDLEFKEQDSKYICNVNSGKYQVKYTIV